MTARIDIAEAADAIPLIETGAGGSLAALDAAAMRLDAIIVAAQRRYGGLLMRSADTVSRRWLRRTANPYLAEIEGIAARIKVPGAYMLNLSYEWGCTTGVDADPDGRGNRMLRTLDWPLAGLGRALIVSHQEGAAGPYYNVTWPGFVGVTTAMAPGRFSAAVNQPPMRWSSPIMAFDWLVNRLAIWRVGGLPPAHLLRKVFDECRTYAEAREMLLETPVCLPAFFSLSGTRPDESCAIERLETRAALREGPVSTANHWICLRVPGRARGTDSRGRWRMMEDIRADAADDFAWVVPPIFNAATRVAVIANAALGKLVVQGWEADGPVTSVFTL